MSGLFGVVAREDCASVLLHGTDYHSHLGTEYGGLALLHDGTFMRHIHSISRSQFKSKFYDDRARMKGTSGIGVISDGEEQPMYLHSRFGPFCLVTSGLVENKAALQEQILAAGLSFSEIAPDGVNTTELVGKLITRGRDLVDGIEHFFSVVQGACSLVLLHKDGLYAARDRCGYSPLVVGKKDGAWAVTTETTAFANTGFTVVKDLKPGEIVLITPRGMVSRSPGRSIEQICALLWIYTGFPASNYDNINVEVVRERCGRFLAQQDKDLEADFVSGVPDSGIAHAIGYAMESGIPYRRPLVKYTPGYGRSYTPPSQEIRDLVATMKLVPIADIIKGNRIVVCDDSIVRGTQLKNFTVKKLWEAGAREVHVRPACPPLMFPCRYALSTRTTKELVARRAIRALESSDNAPIDEYLDATTERYRRMVEWIRNDLGVTTLRYQTVEDMVSAIGLPREQLCLHCWRGEGCTSAGDGCGAMPVRRQKKKHRTTNGKGEKL